MGSEDIDFDKVVAGAETFGALAALVAAVGTFAALFA